MGLRSRIFSRFRQLFVGAEGPPSRPAASRSPEPHGAATRPPSPMVEPARPGSQATPAPSIPTTSLAPTQGGASAEDKSAKHLAKTRRALLQKLNDAEGPLTLGELHDYSERRYFIGHKKFSDLFEAMIDQGVVTWDPQAATASLTERGQIELTSPLA